MCMQKNVNRQVPAFPYPAWNNGDSSEYKCRKCTPSCGLVVSWEIMENGERKKERKLCICMYVIPFSGIIIYKMNSEIAVKAFEVHFVSVARCHKRMNVKSTASCSKWRTEVHILRQPRNSSVKTPTKQNKTTKKEMKSMATYDSKIWWGVCLWKINSHFGLLFQKLCDLKIEMQEWEKWR